MEQHPLVTICIPHWQVKDLVAICLRAIRKHTPKVPYQVIVIDNGSQDESLDYLRDLKWIKLIERGPQTPEQWVYAFVTALEMGFAECASDYYIIMHTDTIVKRDDWLEQMLSPLEADEKCAAAGAWKLERPRPLYEFMKKCTDTKKAKLWLKRNLLGDRSARQLTRQLCPRDYCSIYRSAPIREHNLRYADTKGPYAGYTAGEQMYYQLRDHGYRAEVFGTVEMMDYMEHVAHATAAMQPDLRRLGHRRSQRKAERRLRRLFNEPFIKELTEDASLDN